MNKLVSRGLMMMTVSIFVGWLAVENANAAVETYNLLLLADNATTKILAYDVPSQSYVNLFADAAALLPGSSIRSIATNDAGSKVYVALEVAGAYNAASARIYSYDVAFSGGTLTGTNPTMLLQHTLGGWGSRRSMTVGPDLSGDGIQDVYFTVPVPGWNNETVYWIDAITGGTANVYQNISTAHNHHLEFRSDGSLGWARALTNNDQPRSWDSTLMAVYGETGTLKYDADTTNLMAGPNSWQSLTNNADWRIMDVMFDQDDVLYYSSYYAKHDATFHRRLNSATYDTDLGYWIPAAFSGGGLGVDSSAIGMQPGVMAFLNYQIPEPTSALLLGLSGLALFRRGERRTC